MSASTSYTETELVSLLKGRDSKAFGYLYDNYSDSLYAVIAQMVDDMEIASDVLQEVFINIWRKIDSYDPAKGRLFTWMLNIARNASIDTLRSKSYQNTQKNQPLREKSDWIERGKTMFVEVDNIGLKKVVNRLKKEYRVLIDLAYFKGYTHEEIAEIESIPLGTVKTRIRSALTQLREYLK